MEVIVTDGLQSNWNSWIWPSAPGGSVLPPAGWEPPLCATGVWVGHRQKVLKATWIRIYSDTESKKAGFLRVKYIIIFPAAGRRWQETRSGQTSRQIPPQKKKKNWGKTGRPDRKKKTTDMKTHVCVWEHSVWFRVMGFLGNGVRARWQLLSLNKHADAQSK